MTRMIKDYVEVAEHATLDAMIAQLSRIRDGLPAGSNAEISVRGDAAFGRHICVGFMRPLTAEEAEAEGRYRSVEPPKRRAFG